MVHKFENYTNVHIIIYYCNKKGYIIQILKSMFQILTFSAQKKYFFWI